MSKLLEQVFVKLLMQHINSNRLDNSKQSSYKSVYSTETSMLHIKYEIHLSPSCGESTKLVLLDLSTDHTTLLNHLKSWFGVCGMALKWFTSYRFQAIKIGSTLSELCKLLFGVP